MIPLVSGVSPFWESCGLASSFLKVPRRVLPKYWPALPSGFGASHQSSISAALRLPIPAPRPNPLQSNGPSFVTSNKLPLKPRVLLSGTG